MDSQFCAPEVRLRDGKTRFLMRGFDESLDLFFQCFGVMLLFDLGREVEDFYFLSEVRMGSNVICAIGFEVLNCYWTLV